MFDLFSDPVKVAQQLEILKSELGFALWETMYSLVLETVFAYVIGLPLGVLLVTGEKDGIRPLPGWLMKIINWVINILRSVPFLIMMIISLPLSKLIVGTKVGTPATIPPMVIAAFPLIARMVESSLRELDQGVIEAAQSMGATTWQIVTKVMLPEALPSLISGGTISLTTILGLIVTALAKNAGTSLIQPVALVCIGGLLYATLMTLFVVPCMYEIVSKKTVRRVDEADLVILKD